MRFEDLELSELLGASPGAVTFAGQRALILDAVALGLLRRELIDTFGLTAARGVLTRFGYAHGWRTAESLRDAVAWDSERQWRTAGGRLHTLQGLVRFEPVVRGPEDGPAPFAEAIWHDSYEAEQHLLHLGAADEPVCWSLCGFASGYLSYANGRDVYCVEEKCRGRGDAVCHMVGKPAEEWGDELAPHLPFYRQKCLDDSLERVTRALKRTEKRLAARRHQLARAGAPEDPLGVVARSEGMRELIELAERAARVDATVLVTGESGVGKERLARLVHERSGRAAARFVAISCAALPEPLLDAELFGRGRGAFAGVEGERPGLVTAASGGTLFLDEVGELSLPLQAKLLRVLMEREARQGGGQRSRAPEARLVAATTADLTAAVAAQRFRNDLYYRLKVIELRVPPLRERREDVMPLARTFLAAGARRLGRRVTDIAPEAAARLVAHDWPGNVRELENAIERALALTSGSRVEPQDLPDELRAVPAAPRLAAGVRPLSEVEEEYILAALAANGGNRARTAEQLQIGAATLYRKLRRSRGRS